MEHRDLELKGGKAGLKNRIRHFFAREFFHNSLVQWVFLGALFINLADWGTLAYFIRPVDFPIILHYNVYFGVDLIGSWWQIFMLPLMGALILVVNAFLAYIFFEQKERIASHLLLLAAFAVQAGVSIAAVSVILINY
jgi:hypothetical protein